MTPDHEAAKKWAERVMGQPEATVDDWIARAYLDAIARLEKAEALLKRIESTGGSQRYDLDDEIRAFLESKG